MISEIQEKKKNQIENNNDQSIDEHYQQKNTQQINLIPPFSFLARREIV